MSKPRILICNDDGITAPGILNLIEAVKDIGHVTVVAPDSAQSGMGHAISVGKPLRVYEQNLPHGRKGYACSGTPVDCIKLATGVLMDAKPDILLSGINHGANSSISVVYSGTMSAAMEGAIEGIPSIGFSLCDFAHDADFSASQKIARILVENALSQPLPKGALLNVNIPKLKYQDMKGIKITRQAVGRWVEEFDKRVDPHGRNYYWLTGKFNIEDDGQDTDEWALENGYVSVCPVQFDLTAHHYLPTLNHWQMKL
jgi:5'-nucleotidase